MVPTRDKVVEQILVGDGIAPIQFMLAIRIVLDLIFPQFSQKLGQLSRVGKVVYKNSGLLIRLPVL